MSAKTTKSSKKRRGNFISRVRQRLTFRNRSKESTSSRKQQQHPLSPPSVLDFPTITKPVSSLVHIPVHHEGLNFPELSDEEMMYKPSPMVGSSDHSSVATPLQTAMENHPYDENDGGSDCSNLDTNDETKAGAEGAISGEETKAHPKSPYRRPDSDEAPSTTQETKTTTSVPSSPRSKHPMKVAESLIGQSVRILRHSKVEYVNAVGTIEKIVRRSSVDLQNFTFRVVFKELAAVNKQLKTMELLEAQTAPDSRAQNATTERDRQKESSVQEKDPMKTADALIGRSVRIIRHSKTVYVNAIGRIDKIVRRSSVDLQNFTFLVVFDDLEPVNKQLKTMQLLGGVVPQSDSRGVGVERVAPESNPVVGLSHGESNTATNIGKRQSNEVDSASHDPLNTLIQHNDKGDSGGNELNISQSDIDVEKGNDVEKVALERGDSDPMDHATESSSGTTSHGSISGPLQVGQYVEILRDRRKEYVGQIGKVGASSGKKTYEIYFPDLEPIRKQRQTLELLNGCPEGIQDIDMTRQHEQNSSSGIFRSAETQSRSRQTRTPGATRMNPRTRGKENGTTAIHLDASFDWALSDRKRGGLKFSRRRIVKLRTSAAEKVPTNILEVLFGNRVVEEDVPLNTAEVNADPFQRSFESESGSTFELISTKIHLDGDKGSCAHCKPKCLRLYSIQVKGAFVEPISLREYFERIGNLSALNPRKIKARLELLQSPAYMIEKNEPAITKHESSCFATIADSGEKQGCGFISQDMMVAILGGKRTSKTSRVTSVQVRVIVPRMGWFKGMLTLHPGLEGKLIQLPSSMKKVPASTHPDPREGGVVLVCQGGVYQSDASTNHYIGRMLDQNLKPPPYKSFKSKIRPLSDMIKRMWEGLGVPLDTCDEYARRSRSPQHIAHAWVGGVADFSGLFPRGHVFVPGMTKSANPPKQIYVSRSPCLEPTDGRMLPLVLTKPSEMNEAHWKWLNDLSFGVIMFADPPRGMRSIPEQVADGDLDGDRYFICWDSEILGFIQFAEPIAHDIPSEEESVENTARPYDPNWLEKAQDVMLNGLETDSVQRLMGKLYGLANKETSFRGPDAIAFAKAFKMALDYGKHGKPIYLPQHLHYKVNPPALREYLTAAPE